MQGLALAIALLAAGLLPAQAYAETRKPPKDLSAYSLRFWSRNSLRANQIVTKSTPYGLLTCRSTGVGQPRDCTLR
jgi:hypothetical protein